MYCKMIFQDTFFIYNSICGSAYILSNFEGLIVLNFVHLKAGSVKGEN